MTLWILLAVVAIPVGWVLFKVILSFAVPERVSGVMLLKQELKKLEVPYQHLPDTFFAECVEWADGIARFTGHGSEAKRKAEFVQSLETLALMVSLWRQEPNNEMFAPHGDSPNTYRALFEKYELR